MIAISQVILGEEEERGVLEVLRSGMLAQAEKVALFEEAFAAAHQVTHAVAVSNGTVALTAALRALRYWSWRRGHHHAVQLQRDAQRDTRGRRDRQVRRRAG